MTAVVTQTAVLARIAVALLFAFGANAFANAQAARAWLDRDTMQMGETVTLNVEMQGNTMSPPDFTGLAADFDASDTQSSQQLSIVNGARSAKVLWAVALSPKHDGRITIAPIDVGGTKTNALTLTVQAAAAPAVAKANGDAFIEVTTDPPTPYVQQQVRYTVKLYYAFDLTEGNLDEPHADGVSVHRIGQGQEQRPYSATLAGRRYSVIERHYAITPERSGKIDIPALSFRGTAIDVADPSGFFNRGRAVSARSDAVHLDVKPKPAAWTDATWLPAAGLLLQDQSELPKEIHVGEPITRTVRMQAQGLGFEQLPELTLDAADGADIYPDKSDTRTREDSGWLYGERVRKFAIVPNRAGTLTVPGLKVRWWNTTKDAAEVAELPAQTVNVLPAAGSTPPPAAATKPAAAPVQETPASAPTIAAPIASAAPARNVAGARWWRAIALLAIAAWLVTLGLWWRARQRPAAASAARAAAPVDSGPQRAAFLRAAAAEELAGAERALIAWARAERDDLRNVGELAQRLGDAAQRSAIAELQRARYASASAQGIGTRLQAAFKSGFSWTDAPKARAANSALPALYPDRD